MLSVVCRRRLTLMTPMQPLNLCSTLISKRYKVYICILRKVQGSFRVNSTNASSSTISEFDKKFHRICIKVWGHPFITSTRRGQAQVDAYGLGRRVKPHVDVHTEN